MMFPMRVLPLATGLLLAGCSGPMTTPEPEPAPPPPRVEEGADCGAERVQDRVGRNWSEALGAAIREESGAADLRAIRPDTAVTLDYRGKRLNVHLDETDTITAIDCG